MDTFALRVYGDREVLRSPIFPKIFSFEVSLLYQRSISVHPPPKLERTQFSVDSSTDSYTMRVFWDKMFLRAQYSPKYSLLIFLKLPLHPFSVHCSEIIDDTIFRWSVHRCVRREAGCLSGPVFPPNIPSSLPKVCVLRIQSLSQGWVLVKTWQVFSGPPKSLTEWSMCVTCHLIQTHATHCISKYTKRSETQKVSNTITCCPLVFEIHKQKISLPQKNIKYLLLP